MSSALDMSLDDIIKSNKRSSGGDGGRSRGSGGGGSGPTRRGPSNRTARRSAPYTTAKAPDSTWQHDMYSGNSALGRLTAIETGTKLFISNLDYGVSNEDIKELFAELGDLKRSTIHYDRSGRSKGTAEVVFARRLDAMAAIKRYNNVQLDGKPMKIEIIERARPEAPARKAGFGNSNGVLKSAPQRGASAVQPRRGGGAQKKGRGRGKGRNEKISAEALDADLDNYHSEARQTN